MNWKLLKAQGYEVHITKKTWTLYLNRLFLPPDNLQKIATGRKSKTATRTAVLSRAYPFAVADWVKRRVDNEQRPIFDAKRTRQQAVNQLSNWFANRVDELAYNELMKKL